MIWFDFENAPHVWVLKEIIRRFENEGIEYFLTARDFSSTVKLSHYLGFNPVVIGNSQNIKSPLGKLANTIKRSYLLKKYISQKKYKPTLAVSHGSRSQAFTAKLLNVPAISLDDYEHSFAGFNYFVKNILTPFPIKKESWGKHADKVVNYPGLKEELYLWDESNLTGDVNSLIDPDKINVIFRPESYSSHYHSEKSLQIQDELIKNMFGMENLNIIFFPREAVQKKIILDKFAGSKSKIVVPTGIVNGPTLIAKSDLMICGGGTMSREACALGVPSYTYFGGTLGDVDKYLSGNNKLILINSPEELSKMIFNKRTNYDKIVVSKDAINFVYDFLKKQIV
jgi:uncharacterized protein